MRSHVTFTTYWWQPVLAVTLVSFTVTASLFAVGITHLMKGTGTTEKPFDDITFVVLLSQIIPNFLTIFYELSKLSYEGPLNRNLKTHLYFYVAMALAGSLSLAAPIVYSVKKKEKPNAPAAAILNVCATLVIIFAGLLGVFEVGIKKNGSLNTKRTWKVWKCW